MQTIRGIECPATVQVRVKMTPTSDGSVRFQVVVTSCDVRHNHKISREVYRAYAENRKIVDPSLLGIAQNMFDGGSTVQRILQALRKRSGKAMFSKDIHNIVQGFKLEEREGTQAHRVKRVLCEFAAVEGNVSRMYLDSKDFARCISLQTNKMRQMLDVFPEVLMLDSTHGTNNSKYKLFSFMAHDTFNKGQFVLHSFINRETAENFSDVASALKEVDKDLTEIGALQSAFPDARVLLCRFHVIKALQERLREYRYEKDVHKTLEGMFRLLVSARSEDEYDNARNFMISALPEREFSPFLAYYDESWDNCRSKWVDYERASIPHLGNNTNNRLESAWGKIKPHLTRTTPWDQNIQTVVGCQAVKEDEFDMRINDIRIKINQDYDEEMSALLASASVHATELVYPEYVFATDPGTTYVHHHIVNGIYAVGLTSSGAIKYTTDIENTSCSCFFHRTQLLPCRHLMYLRKLVRSMLEHTCFLSLLNARDSFERRNAARDWVREIEDLLPDEVPADAQLRANIRVLAETVKIIAPSAKMTLYGVPATAADLYDFSGTTWFSDICISIAYKAMIAISQNDERTEWVDPLRYGVETQARHQQFADRQLFRNGIDKVVSVVNYNTNHWCAFGFDMKNNTRIIFDPQQKWQGYAFLNKVCKENYAALLQGKYADMEEKHCKDVQQFDAHNCGVLVVKFVRCFAAGLAMTEMSAEELDFCRCIYMRKAFKEVDIITSAVRKPEYERLELESE